MKSLGGEHNIDPVTLTSLFASGYDTKPPLSVPIHVVELTNIPVELRSNAYIPPDANSEDEELEKNIYRDSDKVRKIVFLLSELLTFVKILLRSSRVLVIDMAHGICQRSIGS